MPRSFAGSPEFQRLLRGDANADLTCIALEIAQDAYPELVLESCLERIDRLATRTRDRLTMTATPRQLLGQINWVLYVEEGYRASVEEHGEPRDSYLNDILERRVGNSFGLATFYRAVAERLGLRLLGVSPPAHFVLRVDLGKGPLFIDPSRDGALLDLDVCRRRVEAMLGATVSMPARWLEPCSTAVIVACMLRDLKAMYLRDHDYTAALPVTRRLAALATDDPTEQRDYGLVCIHVDRPAEALQPLTAYLDRRPEADDAPPVRALLRTAQREVASRN